MSLSQIDKKSEHSLKRPRSERSSSQKINHSPVNVNVSGKKIRGNNNPPQSGNKSVKPVEPMEEEPLENSPEKSDASNELEKSKSQEEIQNEIVENTETLEAPREEREVENAALVQENQVVNDSRMEVEEKEIEKVL